MATRLKGNMAELASIVEQLSKLTVIETAELVKQLETAWGVTAAAPVAAAAAGGAAAGAAAAPAEAKTALKANAAILKSNPSLHIQIEGHCDQRGGIQYNIALGERRAISTMHFLEDRGVSAGRITTISYGKERPIDPAENEEAYAKNRRANFVITSTMANR